MLRFWGDDEVTELGFLKHRPGGKEHGRWMFDYRKTAHHEDEYGYRFGAHRFRFGDYVTTEEASGEEHTFRVVSVAPV